MSTYVVGDIQGCYKSLRDLLKKIHFSANTDSLWCVGDLINRGPQSLDTLRLLQDMDHATRIVLGNHDLHFLAIHYGCAPSGSKDSLGALLNASDAPELAHWLRHKPLVHFDCLDTDQGLQHFLMMHAGIAPAWSLQQTLEHAAEVEVCLQGDDFEAFLKHMYGDTPNRWHDKLQGLDRLRVITNYLTRVRLCDDIGTLNLKHKSGLAGISKPFKAWFEFEKLSPAINLVFGHWASLEGYTGKSHVYALDTGCVWGRQLTAMRLEDKQLFTTA